MGTPLTGCGTALVTPFARDGSIDERAVRRLARRQIDAGIHFLVPVRHDRREPDAVRRRARRASSSWWSRRPRARCRCWPAPAATTRTRSSSSALRMKRAGARRHPVGHAVLQQADAGRPVPALPRDRRRGRAADRGLQRARADRLQRRGRDARAPQRECRTSSASRKRRATCRRSARSAAPCPPDFIVLSGDDALTLPTMAVGGHGIISVASNEVPAEMARMVEAAERGDFDAARARCTRSSSR